MNPDNRRLWAAAFGVIGFFVLKVIYLLRLRFDSDEPQHLHVVWGWTQGLLPYRDIFDNHAPLFQLLVAPAVWLTGEHPETLLIMRALMVPLFVVSLYCVWNVGKRFTSTEAATWAVVVTALSPPYFICSTEFRPDNLWSALWFIALLLIVGQRLTASRCFVVGLIFGAALAVSLKTTLMLFSLGLSGVIIALVDRRNHKHPSAPEICKTSTAAVCGFLIVPLAVVLFFASRGALGHMIDQTIRDNVVRDIGRSKHGHYHLLIFVPTLIGISVITRAIVVLLQPSAVARRHAMVFTLTAVYTAALVSFWPLLSRENFLPIIPLWSLVITAALFQISDFAFNRFVTIPTLVCFAIVGVHVAVLVATQPFLIDRTRPERELVADVLRLTRPDEFVMDGKGETIFRRRPFFPIFEHLTRKRIALGLLRDDLPEQLIATRTLVVTTYHPFPERDVRFIESNYLPIGQLSVVGKLLQASHGETTDGIAFRVLVAATYAIIAEDKPIAGDLDGTIYAGPRFLNIGDHFFRPRIAAPRYAFIWARVLQGRYSPFSVQQVEHPVEY